MAVSRSRVFPSRPHILGWAIATALGGAVLYSNASEIQFNTDVLDVKDKSNYDLGQFSRPGFILPGTYNMVVRVNKRELPEQPVTFIVPEGDPKGSEVCITPELVKQFGLKPDAENKIKWRQHDQCLVMSSLPGIVVNADLATSTVNFSLPQAYLEYESDDWDPPSSWDDGIPGILLDYNFNGQTQRQQREGRQSYNVSGNGTFGTNLGAWRLRADWQSQLDHQGGYDASTRTRFDWSRYYAYRAIPRLGAKLSLGEDYLRSNIFDGFRFAGASLMSDDTMLPPNLRGYAPEVTGVAKTNAKVIISQQGRVLKEVQVAAGPFRIQDLTDAVSGQLDVRVEEADGSIQAFKMDTASIPYLTRPGSVRYKVAIGRPSDFQHHIDGPAFLTSEYSWGVSNGWSMYGGAIAGGDYNAVAVGIGRDLLQLGALSFDVTESRAKLQQYDETLTGGSYRLSYSKRFDDFGSQVTFAGYRFSDRNYMSMGEYLDARASESRLRNSKEMYTVTFNQEIEPLGVTLFLNYNHQTYWDGPANDRYSATVSRYFDLGRFKNLSVSLSGFRNQYNGVNDDGAYLSLSMPFGNSGNVNYSGAFDRNNNTHQVNYYDQIGDHDSYSIGSGYSSNGATASGYYSHEGDFAQMDANASYQDGGYSSVGLGLRGGVTATMKGAALHRTSTQGGTRMLLDTNGVPGIPIGGYGATTETNLLGNAVVTDVSSYYRNKVSIDVNNLPDNADATSSVVQATLTEGAIGYRHFEVISGEKAMAVIRLADGSTPPFGATVINSKKQEVGIVNDEGNVYLSGIKAGEQMSVHWNGQAQCTIDLPKVLTSETIAKLLLPCHR